MLPRKPQRLELKAEDKEELLLQQQQAAQQQQQQQQPSQQADLYHEAFQHDKRTAAQRIGLRK